MRKAFTLIEMVVALGVLAVVLSFAGVIFRVSIDSRHLAMANAEIMQKFRVITEQLDRDFRGVVFDYEGARETRQFTPLRGGARVPVNSDSIAIFVTGDFQTLNLYNGKPVAGNVACVSYEQPDPNSYSSTPGDSEWLPTETVLLRRQTILAGGLDPSIYAAGSGPHKEYYLASLAQWRVNPPFASNREWFLHPRSDQMPVGDYLPMLLARGVDNFMIEYAQRPLNDPNTKGVEQDPATGAIRWRRDVAVNSGTDIVRLSALKFTFTLYDSRGIIENGRTFTHVIVLGG
mgnify:CR=1 FL=1